MAPRSPGPDPCDEWRPGDTSSLRHVVVGVEVAGGPERIDVVNPATGAAVGSVPAGTAGDVDRAVAAFPGWAATPVDERAAVVRRISDGTTERADEIASTITGRDGPADHVLAQGRDHGLEEFLETKSIQR